MKEHSSDRPTFEPTAVGAPHAVPLGRLAGRDHDAVRAALVGRLIDGESARVPVSSFSSSI